VTKVFRVPKRETRNEKLSALQILVLVLVLVHMFIYVQIQIMRVCWYLHFSCSYK